MMLDNRKSVALDQMKGRKNRKGDKPKPFKVFVEIELFALMDLDARQMSAEVSMGIVTYWKDARICHMLKKRDWVLEKGEEWEELHDGKTLHSGDLEKLR